MPRSQQEKIEAQSRTVMLWQEVWEPDKSPILCANCYNARVSSMHGELIASCVQGYGVSKSLAKLIRPKNPHGFASAAKCPEFQSMSDDKKGGKT